jgi:predicted dehydrogenase
MLAAAIVGLGRWGRNLVDAVQGKSERLRFVRGVALELDAARTFAEAHGFEVTNRYEDALADPQVRAVVLATPHLLHTEQIVAAAQAGKQVFCEKPLALNLADARRAVDACRTAGVVLGLGQQRRFWPAVREIGRLMRAGELGEILHVEGHFSNENSNNVLPDSWRDHPDESPGGGMTGAGLHVLDAMIGLLGPVASVHGRMLMKKPQPAPLDSVAALYEFAGGASGILATVRATPLYWRLHMFGSKGSAETLGETELVLRLSGCEAQRPQLAPVDGLRLLLEAFADAAEGGAPYPISTADMLATIAAFEATLASIRDDRLTRVR